MADFDVFNTTLEKYPNQFTTLVVMMRGYAGIVDLKNALKYAQLALQQAPDQQNRTYKENLIKKLKEGKDIN
jgi:predicted GTPase